MKRQEWDFPNESRRGRRNYRVLDAAPEESGWGSPTATKIVSVYWTIVKTILKVVLGAIGGLGLLGCLWLMMQILKVS